jgi:hypothetical protein
MLMLRDERGIVEPQSDLLSTALAVKSPLRCEPYQKLC